MAKNKGTANVPKVVTILMLIAIIAMYISSILFI